MRPLYIVLAVLVVAALAWWTGMPSAHDTASPAPVEQATAAPKPAPANTLEPPQRALSARRNDLFASPIKPPAPRKAQPVVVAETPKPPPLPYKYDGSGELQGKRFVYLTREGKNSMVHAGDTLDGTYAVENVARDHAVLRYLPLGIRQVLMYQAGAEVPSELAAAPSPSRPLALQVDMPAEVVLGQEFVVTVALPGGGALKATVEVRYDTEVLSMVGANQRPSGRVVVEVPGGGTPRAQLRFKVLADTPVSTDIDLKVNATDASGKRVPVWTPKVHTVSLVLPGGA